MSVELNTCSVEPSATVALAQSIPQKVGGKLRFSSENARYFAARGAEKKRQAELERTKAQSSTPPTQPASTDTQTQATDEYTCTSLPRVRSHLDRLSALLAKETDPARLDRLAAAFGKLSEVERQLAGRPLPGSLRPTGKAQNAGMIEQPTSAPVSSSPPAVESDGQE